MNREIYLIRHSESTKNVNNLFGDENATFSLTEKGVADSRILANKIALIVSENSNQYNFYYRPGSLVFIQENLSSLNAGIIPAVSRNRLRSCLVLQDAGDYLIIYAVSMAKTVSLPGLKDKIGDSFSNRAEAIIQWVIRGADRAFGKIPKP